MYVTGYEKNKILLPQFKQLTCNALEWNDLGIKVMPTVFPHRHVLTYPCQVGQVHLCHCQVSSFSALCHHSSPRVHNLQRDDNIRLREKKTKKKRKRKKKNEKKKKEKKKKTK